MEQVPGPQKPADRTADANTSSWVPVPLAFFNKAFAREQPDR